MNQLVLRLKRKSADIPFAAFLFWLLFLFGSALVDLQILTAKSCSNNWKLVALVATNLTKNEKSKGRQAAFWEVEQSRIDSKFQHVSFNLCTKKME